MPQILFRYSWPMNDEANGLATRLVGTSIEVTINEQAIILSMPDAKTVAATMQAPIDCDDAFIEAITTCGFDAQRLADEHKQFLNQHRAPLAEATTRLVRTIKFYLDSPRVSESQLSGFPRYEWSADGNAWQHCPMTFSGGEASVYITPPYAGNLSEQVRAAVANDQPPVLIHAMRFLHRAIREKNPQHRWIDATIAAELGIKEFLARHEPKLEKLLLEVPSPPLTKLYGEILETYAKERSPMLSKLRAGVEVRNRLVHRPGTERVERAAAEQYVRDVEIALLHLTMLLYPTDSVHEYMHARKVERARPETQADKKQK